MKDSGSDNNSWPARVNGLKGALIADLVALEEQDPFNIAARGVRSFAAPVNTTPSIRLLYAILSNAVIKGADFALLLPGEHKLEVWYRLGTRWTLEVQPPYKLATSLVRELEAICAPSGVVRVIAYTERPAYALVRSRDTEHGVRSLVRLVDARH